MSLLEGQPEFEGGSLPESGDGFAIDIRELLRVVKRRWLFIALTIVLATLAGLAHYLLTEKLYRASATLRIEQRLGGSSDRNPWLEAWANSKYYPTQYRLLRSRGLAERVVEHLRLNQAPADVSSAAPLGGELSPGGTAPVGEQAVRHLASRLGSGLSINPVRNTELVEISYVASDPSLAAQIANAYSEVFIQWEMENRSQSFTRTSTLLNAQIETLRREIREKENQLQEAGRGADILQIDSETPVATLSAQRLSELNSAHSEAASTRLELDAKYKQLRGLPDEVAARRHAGSTIGELEREQSRLENEYDVKLQTYKPEWPAMVDLRSRIEEGRQRLQREVAQQAEAARTAAYTEYESALRRERSLLAELQRAKTEVFDQSSDMRDMTNLQTEIAALRQLQDQLMKELSETGLSVDAFESGDSNIHIIDRALVPTSAFRPSLRNDLVLGAAFGLMLGIGLVLLVYFLDRTVKTPEELERLLGLPLLGVIPHVAESNRAGQTYGVYAYGRRRKKIEAEATDLPTAEIEMLPAKRPRLAVSEAYRSLRTALLLSTAEELRVVSITSAEAGEGKTATAINLALVMAQLERRVLLIDSDLRKPRLHRILGLSNRKGLVNFLTGSATAEEIIVQPPGGELAFCPSGPHPPNPSELLASDRMREFLDQVRTRFDLVILDSPPVLPVTDAILLGARADGVVLCSRANKVLREDVKACRDRLRLSDIRVLGAVLNCYRPVQSGYGKRYQYYEAYTETTDDSVADSAA